MIIKVNSRNQITIPKPMCEQLNIKAGDHVLVDVQDGIMILIPESGRYAKHLQGLHCEIWKGVDAQEYVHGERGPGGIQQESSNLGVIEWEMKKGKIEA